MVSSRQWLVESASMGEDSRIIVCASSSNFTEVMIIRYPFAMQIDSVCDEFQPKTFVTSFRVCSKRSIRNPRIDDNG
ncbi:hypothetical protein R5R35_008734 [Gryllus longicercus]|uniref:Uncharacterized protein n=1 Tax=Gryllus longicercus TaxID=2509291 RepID=A0AAN9VHB4_9ORTH